MNYIKALATNNISNGYTDNTFKPNNSITRAEFSLLLARVLDDRFKLNVLPEMEVNPTSEVYVDGIKVNYPVKPIVKNGTTLVPIRETFEAMGVTVEWNEEERSFYSTKGNTKIKLEVDSNRAFINDQPKILSMAPIIYKNKTMIPLRFVGELFGGIVDYNPDNQNINITMPKFTADFLTKEQANISNIKNIEKVELLGNRRLMVSDNPETLNSNTIKEDNSTLWNDVVKENRWISRPPSGWMAY